MSLHPEIASQLEDIVDDLMAEGYTEEEAIEAEGYTEEEAIDIAWTRFDGWSEVGGYYHVPEYWSRVKCS